jgi:hypothetical protein
MTTALFGIDFSPLVPAINDLIKSFAGLIILATPVLMGMGGRWLYTHSLQSKEAAGQINASRLTASVQNGLKFAQVSQPVKDDTPGGASVPSNALTVPVSDPKIAMAANYVIAQAAEQLKKAGIDITTDEGQKTLIRRITAESAPAPAAATPQLDVHLDNNTGAS